MAISQSNIFNQYWFSDLIVVNVLPISCKYCWRSLILPKGIRYIRSEVHSTQIIVLKDNALYVIKWFYKIEQWRASPILSNYLTLCRTIRVKSIIRRIHCIIIEKSNYIFDYTWLSRWRSNSDIPQDAANIKNYLENTVLSQMVRDPAESI